MRRSRPVTGLWALGLGLLAGCLADTRPPAGGGAAPRPEVRHTLKPSPGPGPEIRPVTAVSPPAPALLSTVANPDAPERPIGLAECVALALENGRTGDYYDGPGGGQLTSVTGLRRPREPGTVSDSIRVLAYDPAAAGTEVERALSRFDVFARTDLFWNRIDQKSRLLFDPTPFQEFVNRNKLDTVDFRTGLYKPLPTGGIAGVTLRTEYVDQLLTPNSQIVNPAYRPFFELSFEQPLLQGSGVLINQIRDQLPVGLRQNLPDPGRTPGILLVRVARRQSELEFERQVQDLLFRVEEAYWGLYAAYWGLYAADNGLRQAYAAWQVAKARYDAGGLGVEDLAQIEDQYHAFRALRLEALGRGQPGRPGVLEAERRLRYVVGLPPEDGTRLTPCEDLSFVAYEPDPRLSAEEAAFHRPELRQVEEEIRAAELLLIRAKDQLRPDLRLVSRYDVNGLGDDLGEGIGDLIDSGRHEWELGMRLQFPLGFRAGHAETARARLELAQRLALLQDQKTKLLFSLQRSYRELVQYREEYRARRSQRQAAALQLKGRYEKFKAGGDPKQAGFFIELVLRAQRTWAEAVREEYLALCRYRTAVADFERQKGTICRYENVVIAECAAPGPAAPHASRYLRDWRGRRAKAGEGVTTAELAGRGHRLRGLTHEAGAELVIREWGTVPPATGGPDASPAEGLDPPLAPEPPPVGGPGVTLGAPRPREAGGDDRPSH